MLHYLGGTPFGPIVVCRYVQPFCRGRRSQPEYQCALCAKDNEIEQLRRVGKQLSSEVASYKAQYEEAKDLLDGERAARADEVRRMLLDTQRHRKGKKR